MTPEQALKKARVADKNRAELIAYLRKLPESKLRKAANEANLWRFHTKLFDYPSDITTAKLVKITTALANMK